MTKLDKAANIAILVLCVTATLALARNHLAPTAPATELQAGERVRALAEHVPADAERVLLVALSPDCRYCDESMDFYARLSKAPRDPATRLVAAVGWETHREREAMTTAAAGVRFDDLVVADFPAARLLATPTIVLADRRGTVLDVWHGKLAPQAEQEVLRALG